MLDYFSAVLSRPKIKEAFKTIMQLEKESKPIEKSVKRLYDLNPWDMPLSWISKNHLSSMLCFQLQQLFCKKSHEQFKKLWRDEIVKKGALPDDTKLIEKTLSSYDLKDFFALYKTPSVNINRFPTFSFFIQFTFTLAKPFLSRDDDDFYLCENPIKKDKVFKVPMIPGSAWKGNMRWTAGKQLEMNEANSDVRLKKRIQLTQLFGHENEAEEKYHNSLMEDKKDEFKRELKNLTSAGGLKKGRCRFYPTFFTSIGLEVINPHDRKTRSGSQPIFIECVPAGAQGGFSLLYMPFDLLGRPRAAMEKEAGDDLNLTFHSLKEMMLTFGFSAKKSSGFGVIEEKVKGTFEMSGCTIDQEKLPFTKKIDTSNPFACLTALHPHDISFASFDELEQIIKALNCGGKKNG